MKNGEMRMKCDECGKEFRPTTAWQRFCSPTCRNAFHNRAWRQAERNASRSVYAAMVAAHETRLYGHALTKQHIERIEPVALPPEPKLIRRPLVVKPKNEDEEAQAA